MWYRVFLTLLLCGVLPGPLAPGAAWGDDLARARQHYQRGERHYLAGRYAAAHEQFAIAHRLTPLPDLLYNMARADEQIGHIREAIEHLDAFLQAPGAANQDQVRAYRESLLRRHKIAPEVAPPAPVTAPPAAARDVQVPIRATAASPSAALRIAKWTLAGAGVLGVGLGATLIALDGRQDCGIAAGQCLLELDSKAGGVAVLTSGLVMIGVSGVLFGLDHRRNRRLRSP